MTDDPRCCGSGTCLIDAEGRCWCGQQWDGEKMAAPPAGQADAQHPAADEPPDSRASINWLTKLPGFERSRHGLEWVIWKRLPAVLFWGSAIPLALAALLWVLAPSQPEGAPQDPGSLLLIYQLIGLVVLHVTLVLTVAIGCAIVMLMKGPAYVADAYPPPGRDAQA